ncbi:hypothetical protein ACIQZB_37945 [Streptomyces sp. NPDC097727]|uniref:hypothetical protein n=1 Tax=Streptomyces sp. NPDC097727 TaxID=3366092 RepID=UPI0037FA4927
MGEHESYGYLVLNGELTPAEVGTAVMRIADCNDFEPEEEHGPCPTDPLGTFLHGLLTMPDLFAAGGFRVTDNATDTVFVAPGCCNGLETWRDWLDVLNGTGCAYFGHDPSSMAKRLGDIVRLTLDAHGTDGSPVIELSVDQIRTLVAGAQQDLQDFLSLAATWAEQHLPAHAAAVTAALSRALDLRREGDRLLTASAFLQQPGRGCGCCPPARGQVRVEHLERLDLPVLPAERSCPLQRAEPLPAARLALHLLGVAELEQPRDQLRRDAAGPCPGPVFKIRSVHDHAP